MPGVLSARKRPVVRLVCHAPGRHAFSDASEPLGLGYMWVTDSRELIIALNDASTGDVVRRAFPVDTIHLLNGSSRAVLTDGRSIDTKVKPCGCGMGAAGNAPFMAQPHRIEMVPRAEMPEWVRLG